MATLRPTDGGDEDEFSSKVHDDPDAERRRRRRRERAQAIILAGFILAVGIVAAVVILNNTIGALNLGSGEADVSSGPVNYRESMESESRKALDVVNELARQRGFHWRDANETYVDYVNDLNFRMQKVIGADAAVGLANLSVNASFNNSWRVRKNQTTPFQQVVRRPVEVVYVLDSSGSMQFNDADGERYEAAKEMTANLSALDRVSVVDYDDEAGHHHNGILMPFTNASGAGQTSFNQTVNDLIAEEQGDSPDAEGSTYIGGGLREAIDLFREEGRASHDNVVVLLTDGQNQNGWLHYPSTYVRSHADTDSDVDNEFEPEVWRHEWGYVDNAGGGFNDFCIGDTMTCEDSFNGDVDFLNERTKEIAIAGDNQSISIYTVQLNGTGDRNTALLKNLSSLTGGQWYGGTDSDLGGIFNQIADDISDPRSLASNVTRFDRFHVSVESFSVARNLTVMVRDSDTDELLWQMNVSNESGRKVVSVRGNGSTSDTWNRSWNWTDPAIGGPPFEIDVLDHTIAGVERNLSSGLFLGEANVSVVFDEGQGVNGTYDVWVDRNADVTGQCGPPVPCVGKTNQTVGAIREANFSIQYESDSVSFTDDVAVTATDGATADAPSGLAPATPPAPPSGGPERLHFDPPYHDMETYWPFDQNLSSATWPDEHAFDAMEFNHTGGLAPDIPERGVVGIDNAAYNFSTDATVIDEDGWNEIPLEGPFTLSLWIETDTLINLNGTIVDATRSGGPTFELGYFDAPTGDDSVTWEYSSGGTEVNDLTVDIDPATEWWNVVVVGGWNQSVHGIFARPRNSPPDPSYWRRDVDDSTDMPGKPMQPPIGSGTYNATNIGHPLVNNSGHDGFFNRGFPGTVDDVRLYHHRLAEATFDVDTHFEDGFNASGDDPSTDDAVNWAFANSAGLNNVTWNEDWNSAFTCCEADSRMTMPDTGPDPSDVDLSGVSSATVSAWIRLGDDGFSETVENVDEDLELYYESDATGGWRLLRSFEAENHNGGDVISYSEQLPADALASGFRLRFSQQNGDGNCCGGALSGSDYWHIDDVEVFTSSLDSLSVGGLNQVYNDVSGTDPVTADPTPDPPDERNRFFVTDYQRFDDPVDVQNLELRDVKADNGSDQLRVRVESNLSTNGVDPNTMPENVSDWIEIEPGTERYDVPPEPGVNSVNLTVPNDELRLRVEALSRGENTSPRFLEADLVAP